MKNQIKLLLVAGFISLLTGCASTKATHDSTYGGKLPVPDHVYVYNFSVSPDEVQLDRGIGGDIRKLVSKTPRTDAERDIGRKVANALASHLMTEIGNLGFLTTRAFGPLPKSGDFLVIRGQFISIDEGNQAERVVIGLGMGRTDVQTVVQAYDYHNGKQVLATQFETNAKSGSSPGMAETLGAGAATGHLVTSAVVSSGVQVGTESFSANVDADADRSAKLIAQQIQAYAISQGWMGK